MAPPVATSNMVSTAYFKSTRSFKGVFVFLGDQGQSLCHWSVEFVTKADIFWVEHDNLRELRLKLAGPAREFNDRQWAGTDDPELSVVLAYLPGEFGTKYEESGLLADYFRFQRKPCTPGNLKEVICTLTNTRQKMHVAGMPVTMSGLAPPPLYALTLATLYGLGQVAGYICGCGGR